MTKKILKSSDLNKISGGNQCLGNHENENAAIITLCENRRCSRCGAELTIISSTDEGNGFSIEYKCNTCGCGGGGFIYKD